MNIVKVDGKEIEILSQSNQEIIIQIPETTQVSNATSSIEVSLGPLSDNFNFTYLDSETPVITLITPQEINYYERQEILIDGMFIDGDLANTEVYARNSADLTMTLLDIKSSSPLQITVENTGLLIGEYSILIIQKNCGKAKVTSIGVDEVSVKMEIDSLNISEVSQLGGLSLEIIGTNFPIVTELTEVRIGNPLNKSSNHFIESMIVIFSFISNFHY